ncbi:hypothetical protein PVE99_30445 [Priestia megaterium]|uniref:Uncharacterized protein n=1 Tax=Priestia megaterium TaxID=1404 RepID=A0ABD4X392_PRIMG|nr:hypothetical protein [Priestia megaterium]MDD9786681.1 hypothetical protein [Priestia megaterium]
MKNLKLEAETIQVSIYCEIILQILYKHKELSINKILVFAYLIKKDRFISRKIYNGNNTQDIIYKCISMLSGDYIEYCNSIEFILKAIHLLNENNLLSIENDVLHGSTAVTFDKYIYEESMFFEKAIEASKRMNDMQFMKEVTHIV